MDEPISDEVRSILDGHVVLDRAVAMRGRYPAVDPLQSVSRLHDRLVGPEASRASSWMRKTMAMYEEHRDLITVGAYRKGSDPALDVAIAAMGDIEAFLAQSTEEDIAFDAATADLVDLCRRYGGSGPGE